MNKNYFSSMREFTAEMNSNKASHDRARVKTAEDYAEAKGSMLYDRVFAEVDNDFSTRRAATVEKYKKGLSDDKAKDIAESILNECPAQYRNAYEDFRKSGIVSDLNDPNESI